LLVRLKFHVALPPVSLENWLMRLKFHIALTPVYVENCLLHLKFHIALTPVYVENCLLRLKFHIALTPVYVENCLLCLKFHIALTPGYIEIACSASSFMLRCFVFIACLGFSRLCFCIEVNIVNSLRNVSVSDVLNGIVCLLIDWSVISRVKYLLSHFTSLFSSANCSRHCDRLFSASFTGFHHICLRAVDGIVILVEFWPEPAASCTNNWNNCLLHSWLSVTWITNNTLDLHNCFTIKMILLLVVVLMMVFVFIMRNYQSPFELCAMFHRSRWTSVRLNLL